MGINVCYAAMHIKRVGWSADTLGQNVAGCPLVEAVPEMDSANPSKSKVISTVEFAANVPLRAEKLAQVYDTDTIMTALLIEFNTRTIDSCLSIRGVIQSN